MIALLRLSGKNSYFVSELVEGEDLTHLLYFKVTAEIQYNIYEITKFFIVLTEKLLHLLLWNSSHIFWSTFATQLLQVNVKKEK